jgi:hypothetical protein
MDSPSVKKQHKSERGDNHGEDSFEQRVDGGPREASGEKSL